MPVAVRATGAPLLAAHGACFGLHQAQNVLASGAPSPPPAGAWALEWHAELAAVAPRSVVAAVVAAAAAGREKKAHPAPPAVAHLRRLAAGGYAAFVDGVAAMPR